MDMDTCIAIYYLWATQNPPKLTLNKQTIPAWIATKEVHHLTRYDFIDANTVSWSVINQGVGPNRSYNL